MSGLYVFLVDLLSYLPLVHAALALLFSETGYETLGLATRLRI